MVEMELGPEDRLRILRALQAYKDEGTQLLEDRKRAVDEEKAHTAMQSSGPRSAC